ncbi:MAG: hypothetical protein R2844_00935 [Caldilineales bacterium]
MYKAIDELQWEEGQLARVLATYLAKAEQMQLLYLLGVDVTPQPRPYIADGPVAWSISQQW